MEQNNQLPAIYVETYGCQMNVLDTELVRGQLQTLGYCSTQTIDEAAVILVNTCSVRDLSEQKVWSLLGRLALRKKRQADLVVGILGCMAEREGRHFFVRAPVVDLVCGPSELDKLPSLLHGILQDRQQQQALANDQAPEKQKSKPSKEQRLQRQAIALSGHNSRRSSTLDKAKESLEHLDLSRSLSALDSSFQAYVRITRGCNKFCHFCVVPYTRGPEVHRSPWHILEECKRLVGAGIKEITLLGQTVNHYVYKKGEKTTSFADLLALLHDQLTDLPRLRFVTSYPRDFGDDALDVMAQSPRICRYLHIPAQSGSDVVLKRMNRGYNVETYLSLVQRAYARMPDLALSGDMIAGFSGETDACHQASLDFLKKVRYKSCFVFKYSPREGTVAARRLVDDVPEAVKKQRNLELLQLQSEISLQRHRHFVGQSITVLVEGKNRIKQAACNDDRLQEENQAVVRLAGRTGGDEIVAFDGPLSLIGSIVELKVRDATPLTLLAALPQLASQTKPSLRSFNKLVAIS